MKRTQQGFAPIYVIIAAVAAVALLIGGFVAFRLHLNKAVSGPDGGQPTAVQDDMTSLAAPDVNLDFSISPIADLAVPTLDIGPTMPGNVVSGMNIDTDIGYSGSVSITRPTVKISAPTMPTISAPPAAPPVSQPSSEGSGAAPAEGQGQGSVTAANCAPFAAIPSAQYCSQVGDSNGRTLCEACKAAGY
jgi:hypothetical protein